MTDPHVAPDETPATAAPAGRWEDFVDLFYAPATVFARRAESSFWTPMLVTTLVMGLTLFLTFGQMSPIFEAEIGRAMAAAAKSNPAITPEIIAQQAALQLKIARYAAVIFIPIIITVVALSLWLIGKAVGAKQSWNAALVVASYAYFPKVLEPIVNGGMAMMADPSTLNGRYRVSLGLGRFFDPDTASPVLVALLGRVDVFTVAVTILIAIGVSATGKVGRAEGALVGVLVWLVGALPTVVPALMR